MDENSWVYREWGRQQGKTARRSKAMKKTGSIRCEIISGVDDDLYQLSVKDERNMSVLFCVPKSAVTDIHEEVDWVGIEKDTLVVVWNRAERPGAWGRPGFFKGKVANKYLVAEARTCKPLSYDNCMLLTDWLKEYGNKEPSHEEGGQDE